MGIGIRMKINRIIDIWQIITLIPVDIFVIPFIRFMESNQRKSLGNNERFAKRLRNSCGHSQFAVKVT
jgi:hypothetical protein